MESTQIDKVTINFSKGFRDGIIKGTKISNKITTQLTDYISKLYLIQVLKDIGLKAINNGDQIFKYNRTQYDILNKQKQIIELNNYTMIYLGSAIITFEGLNITKFKQVNGKYQIFKEPINLYLSPPKIAEFMRKGGGFNKSINLHPPPSKIAEILSKGTRMRGKDNRIYEIGVDKKWHLVEEIQKPIIEVEKPKGMLTNCVAGTGEFDLITRENYPKDQMILKNILYKLPVGTDKEGNPIYHCFPIESLYRYIVINSKKTWDEEREVFYKGNVKHPILDQLLTIEELEDIKKFHKILNKINEDFIEASKNKNKNRMQELLNKGVNINFQDIDGKTALFNASEKGHKVIVELLLNNGAKLNIIDNGGDTALMKATNKEIVKLLLNKGADPNIKNGIGDTALLKATNKDIVELLLNNGAKLNIIDNGGNTPLMNASYDGNKDIVELLLNKGVNPDYQDLNEGNTALMKADDKDIVELLLDKGADPDIKNNADETVLMNTIYERSKDIAELLLNKGADPNIKDFYGDTALIIASREDNKDIVKLLLLNKDTIINIKDNDGDTALMKAINKDIVELLLNKGADPNIKNDNGDTALMIASIEGYKDIVELLNNY